MTPPPHVLLVEDEAEIRELMATILEMEGFQVVCASDGLEALRLLRGGPPAVIVMDLMMPRMNGWELAAHLRGDPDLSSVPVVLVSGVADLAARSQELHAQAHLTKPVDVDELVASVRRWLPAAS